MFKVISLLICSLYFFPSLVLASESWFVSTKIGIADPIKSHEETNLNIVKFDFDNGVDYSVSIGKEINNFGIEVEYSKRNLNSNTRFVIPTGDIEALEGSQDQEAVFINGYYYPAINEPLSVFVGIGMGLTVVKWNAVTTNTSSGNINSNDVVHSYKAVLGVGAHITEMISIEAAYNYQLIEDVTLTASDGSLGIMNNQDIRVISLGLKFGF